MTTRNATLRRQNVALAAAAALAALGGGEQRASAQGSGFDVSAYAVCDSMTPCHGMTASGRRVQPGITVAADWAVLPPGSWVEIEGVGARRVDDRGGRIVGQRLDLFMASAPEARSWGRRTLSAQAVPEPAPAARPFPFERLSRGPTRWCHAVPAAGGGWWTARHCAKPGERLFVDGRRVIGVSLDPTRDLAHVVTEGGAPAVRLGKLGAEATWVTNQGATQARVAGPRTFVHDARTGGWWEEGMYSGPPEMGQSQTLVVVCVTGGTPLRPGVSGAGVWSDGALGGIVVGGDVDWRPDSTPWARAECGRSQRVLVQEVP